MTNTGEKPSQMKDREGQGEEGMWTDKRQISTAPVPENVLASSLQGWVEGQLSCQKTVNPNLPPLCLAPKWSCLSPGMCRSFDSLHRSQTPGRVPALAPLLCPVIDSCVPHMYFGLTQGAAKSSTRRADRFLQSSEWR